MTIPLQTPLNIGDTCKVQWRGNANKLLNAVVVERRQVGYRKRKNGGAKPPDLKDLAPDAIEYYVHYTEHDRRLDEWLTLDKFVLSTLQRCEPANEEHLVLSPRPNRHLTEHDTLVESTEAETPLFTLSGGNWHGRSGGGEGSMTALEREHEQATKVKNIEKIIMGKWQVEAWYYSPFPAEYSDLECLYVCEFCLDYMKKTKTYKNHLQTCTCRKPPGHPIYRHDDLVVYELDGKDHRAYCQKLFLLAKLFLDHKTLYFEPTPFLVYVVAKVDSSGEQIVGYFSKEKNSAEGYNLACILTFPQYQKSGYGKFIISLSYEITKREGKTGSPEKPLSDLGKVSYRSYWTHMLMHSLANHKEGDDTNINQISEQTGIRSEDLISTLQSLDMIKVWKGQHVIYVQQSMIRDYLKQDKKFRLCEPSHLDWEPKPSTETPE